MEVGKHIAYDLRSPHDIGKFSKVLQDFIRKGNLTVKFSKKADAPEFVLCDGWKFAALNFGLTPRIDECVKVSSGNVYCAFSRVVNGQFGPYDEVVCVTDIPEEIEECKAAGHKLKRIRECTYRVKCSLVNIATGEVMGDGEAVCSNLEIKKLSFDEYAVASMAQTRGISKACKNLLGFVMRLAGFAETPAEEMEEEYTHKEIVKAPAADSIKNQASKLSDADTEEIKHQLSLLNTEEEVLAYGQKQTPALQKNLVFRGLILKRIAKINPNSKLNKKKA